MDGSQAITTTTAGSGTAGASSRSGSAPAKKPAPKRYVRSQIPREISEDPALLAATSVLPPNYNLEVPKTVWRVRQAKARCVALQLPEGLQMFATTLCDIIERFGGAESCVILGDVTYGACCIDDVTAAALGADFLVHYGHSCLVPLDHTAIPCLYVFVDITIDVPHFIDTLKLNFPKTDHLVLAGTIQFTAAVHAARAALSDHFRAITVPQAKPLSGGEVLGCTAPSLLPLGEYAVIHKGSELLGADHKARGAAQGAAAGAAPAGAGAGEAVVVSTAGEGNGAVQAAGAAAAVAVGGAAAAPATAAAAGAAAAAAAGGNRPDALVFVSDGRFHLEAMMIANPSLPAYRYDPYARSLTRERYDHSGMRAARQLAVTRASRVRGKRWGVVQGTLGHQGNPRTVDHCVRRIRAAGGTPVVFLVSELTPEKVAAVGVGSGGMARPSEDESASGDVAGATADLAKATGGDEVRTTDTDCVVRELGGLSLAGAGARGIDAWVQVACPRLSIDWGEAFAAPMLTPYELEVALGFAPPWWGGCFCDSIQGDSIEYGSSEGDRHDDSKEQQQCKRCGACKGDKERVYPMDHYARDGGPWNASYMPKRAAR
ncbi:hypothetical protein CLOM_g6420 [Closterium sp. NIES-68]|nr:hypothetical protein CLOM_g6420 [Closterium sp. NIES-68]GJP69401.1 hypothetical protein CLOP_g331 [Closterium sp. NIES-67]